MSTAPKTNWVQIAAGIFFLCTGALVYIALRPPHATYFVDALCPRLSLYETLAPLLRIAPLKKISLNMASFLHVLSFIMLTAGFCRPSKKSYLLICLSWCMINSAFEWGQKIDGSTANVFPEWFNNIIFLKAIPRFFQQGTFDMFDMAAIFSGSLIGYGLLLVTMQKE